MALADDLERIAAAARQHGEVTAVIAAEPEPGRRAYLVAFPDGPPEGRGWLVVDTAGEPIVQRDLIRDAVTIAALCEVAEESAFGGDLDELRAQLVALRISERPAGIEEAEEAALALQHVLGSPPQLASPTRLDAIGQATRRLEQALDPAVGSPFAAAMQAAQGAVEAIAREVEEGYLTVLQ